MSCVSFSPLRSFFEELRKHVEHLEASAAVLIVLEGPSQSSPRLGDHVELETKRLGGAIHVGHGRPRQGQRVARVQAVGVDSLRTDLAEVPKASARPAQKVALIGADRLACGLKIMARFEEARLERAFGMSLQ